LWQWIPKDRTRGQLYVPDATGHLVPTGADDQPLRRKEKGVRQRTVLVPGRPEYVRAVRLVFDLYTRAGLSRRAISAKLNTAGHTFNGGPFTHPDVTVILTNPAYLGDTHFGKRRTAKHFSFTAAGTLVPVDNRQGRLRRPVEDRLVKEGTHDPLIDRATWDLAQEKLAWEREQLTEPDRHGHCHATRIASRNPAYYLRQLLICGHCGKPMAGRTETDWRSGKKRTVYVCSTYVKGRCGGHPVQCGHQTITHADAEQLLLDKVKELNLQFDQLASGGARATLKDRLRLLGVEDEQSLQKWQGQVDEGIEAFFDWLEQSGIDPDHGQRLRQVLAQHAANYYTGAVNGTLKRPGAATLAGLLDRVRDAIVESETLAVERAGAKLATLREDLATYTRNWVKATASMQAVLKQDIDRLEAEIAEWEPRTKPLSERFQVLYAAEAERQAERKKLLAEWPSLESREKGEAFRRLFKEVRLFWLKRYHPASERPTRRRTTSRPGRWSYHLDRGRIEWAYPVSDLADSW
jgi:hypothetical protein